MHPALRDAPRVHLTRARARLAWAFAALAVAGSALQYAAPAAAQAYPTRKPVTLVVPFAPGTSSDIAGRIIAEALSQTLGQKVVVENKPGAGGAIGLDAVAKAAPDGYTLGAASTGFTVLPIALGEKRPYELMVDLVPVALTNDLPLVLVSTPEIPPRTMREFLAYAKAHPIQFATVGPGTGAHVLGAAIMQAAGAKADAVHYKGSGIVDLIAGRVQASVEGSGSTAAHIKAGKLVGLGVFTPRRLPSMPDLPTMAEAWPDGPEFLKTGAVVTTFIVAPAKVPGDIMTKINADLNRAMADPGVRAKLEQVGLLPRAAASLEQSGAHINGQIQSWTRSVAATGIKEAVKAAN